MTLALAAVCDLDCVASWSPLVLDLPSPNRYARGPAAILRRVLYSWERDASVPLSRLEGVRYDRNWLLRYRVELEGLARAVPFVAGSSCPLLLSPDGARLTIRARIPLVDGRVYPLEVATLDAGAAILAIGASA